MALTVPSIPSVPRSLSQDAQAFCSAVKYTLDVREGRIGDEHRFVTSGEVEGFIRDIYSNAKGKTFIKKVANFMGDAGLGSDIHLSDITGDGLVVITADGQIVISAPGGLVIQDEGTLIIDTGDPTAPSGYGLIVGSVPTTTGWVLSQTGQFGWYNGLSASCIVLDDNVGAGIAWQQETAGGLEPINVAFKVYAGDQIIGGYNYKVTATGKQFGGLFWDQSAGTIYIRGNIVNSVVDTNGILTISGTGYIYIEATTANSGLLVGNLGTSTGWWINATGLFAYAGATQSHAFCISDGVTWQSNTINQHDVVLGTYFSNKGVFWDQSVGKLYVKGEIVDGTVSTGSELEVNLTGILYINTSTAGAGLVVGNLAGGTGVGINSNGIAMVGASVELHAFLTAATTWQSTALGVGDVVIGQYFSAAAGMWWDQAPTPTLHIKGNLDVVSVGQGNTFTITGTGYLYLNTTEVGGGLLVGSYATGTGWLVNAKGFFGYASNVNYYCFPLAAVSIQGLSMTAGDFLIGNYEGGQGYVYFDQSASGTLYIKGNLYVDGGKTIEISSTGTFTMYAGTFSIEGGTVSISSTSGMTIAAGSKITVNSTDGIFFSTHGQLYHSSTNLYLSTTATMTVYGATAASLGSITAAVTCSGYNVLIGGSATKFGPSGTGIDCGDPTAYFDDTYSDTYYQKTPGAADDSVTSFDHLDDLGMVLRYGGPGSPTLFDVLPVECTNLAKLAKEEGITVDEAKTRQDLRKRIFYNPLLVGIFGIGAIKQLYQEVQELKRRVQ